MEVLRITGKNTQGVFPRVISELVRRKVEMCRVFFHGENGHVEIIIEIRNTSLNGKLLHALRALQDVISADYIKEKIISRWEFNPKSEHVTTFTDSMRNDNRNSEV